VAEESPGVEPLAPAIFSAVAPGPVAARDFPSVDSLLVRMKADGEALDAFGAAKLAKQRVSDLTGDDPAALKVDLSRLDSTGVWNIELVRPAGDRARITLTENGWATLVDLRASAAGPRVFISYAHESEDHKRSVSQFAAFLITEGMDVRIDSEDNQGRRDWQLWASKEIRAADFVLVIASPQCREVGDGDEPPDVPRGLRAEMNTLRELYYSEPHVWPKKILPVVLPGRSVREIPIFLQPYTADHYDVASFTDEGARPLLRHLRHPPEQRHPPG
ncbi:MAG TPA: SEFIR domain-containing protein, partial [Streptosporangiaceae bacterium]|nr:SEFIR domain-containing protein [Streptosporangiaceae bacterium]